MLKKTLEKNHKNLGFYPQIASQRSLCSKENETGNHRWCCAEMVHVRKMRENSSQGNYNFKMLYPKLTDWRLNMHLCVLSEKCTV